MGYGRKKLVNGGRNPLKWSYGRKKPLKTELWAEETGLMAEETPLKWSYGRKKPLKTELWAEETP